MDAYSARGSSLFALFDEAAEVFAHGEGEVVCDGEFALCKGAVLRGVVEEDGAVSAVLEVDGGAEDGADFGVDILEDIFGKARVIFGVCDDEAGVFVDAPTDDALSDGDAEVEEGIGVWALGGFEPEFTAGVVDIGQEDAAVVGVDLFESEAEGKFHGFGAVFAVVVDVHDAHEEVGEDLLCKARFVFALDLGEIGDGDAVWRWVIRGEGLLGGVGLCCWCIGLCDRWVGLCGGVGLCFGGGEVVPGLCGFVGAARAGGFFEGRDVEFGFGGIDGGGFYGVSEVLNGGVEGRGGGGDVADGEDPSRSGVGDVVGFLVIDVAHDIAWDFAFIDLFEGDAQGREPVRGFDDDGLLFAGVGGVRDLHFKCHDSVFLRWVGTAPIVAQAW